MTLKEVRRLYKTTPFRPFVLHLADGRNIEVIHPEFLALDPKERTIIVYQPDGDFNIVDLLLVTDIEIVNGATKPKRR